MHLWLIEASYLTVLILLYSNYQNETAERLRMAMNQNTDQINPVIYIYSIYLKIDIPIYIYFRDMLVSL